MRSALVVAMLASCSASVVLGQCAIQPIKPIPPIGCKDLVPTCNTDGKGNAYWTWACVKNDSSKSAWDDGWNSSRPTPKSRPLQIPIPTPAPPLPPLPTASTATAPTPDISWVKVGMAQQEVLSGLTGHFKMTKEGDLNETGSQIQIWAVESLTLPAQEFWEIAFSDGKVVSIITNSLRSLQGDALALAQRLFVELYARGDTDNSKAGKFLGTRDLTVQVKMFQMPSDKGNEETMRFEFDNGRSFEIKINVPMKGNSDVKITTFQTQ